MLRELSLKNFVLIEEAELRPAPDFTVITGDTGAGKSLLVKAFKLILGARAESRLVGQWGKRALVQAVFDEDEYIRDFLDERGIDCQGELVVRRVISADGKGQIFINSVRCILADLRTLAGHLVSIAGQHEFQRLLDKETQIRWLDEYARISISRLSSMLFEARALQEEMSSLVAKRERLRERREELLEEMKAIDEIAPEPGEEDALSGELRLLKQVEKMRNLGQELYQRLYGERQSVVDGLVGCGKLLEKMALIDPSLEDLASRMESLVLEADDVSASIRDYLFNLPLDDSRLRQVEDRLFKLRSLKKRFGPSIEDVMRHRQTIEKELSQMEDIDFRLEKMRGKLDKKEREVVDEARKISKKRKEAAERFQSAVKEQLKELNLPRVRFEVRIDTPTEPDLADIGSKGMDRVSFFFSANPGQALQPLSQVASGGELSRVLLAIKVVMGGMAESETLIFDEIDSGLGGEVAEKVGMKLRAISHKTQVIAITHFPQIASLAHSHVLVQKRQYESHTASRMFELKGRERIQEIARMLGGDSEKAKEYAKELLGPVFRGT